MIVLLLGIFMLVTRQTFASGLGMCSSLLHLCSQHRMQDQSCRMILTVKGRHADISHICATDQVVARISSLKFH